MASPQKIDDAWLSPLLPVTKMMLFLITSSLQTLITSMLNYNVYYLLFQQKGSTFFL